MATEITARLRAAADWIDTHELPDDTSLIISQGVKLAIFCYTTDALRATRKLVGSVTKTEGIAGGMLLEGEVDGVPVILWPPEGVCKQVQVGTETVEREEVVETRTVTEEVPVYEWDCGSVLADVEAVSA